MTTVREKASRGKTVESHRSQRTREMGHPAQPFQRILRRGLGF
jgi:hypothetical protein